MVCWFMVVVGFGTVGVAVVPRQGDSDVVSERKRVLIRFNPRYTSYSLNFISATTSESPSPGTTATTMVPNPTTTMNQQTIMTTQPSLSHDTDVTVVQDISCDTDG